MADFRLLTIAFEIMIGAKKLTLNTLRHNSNDVSLKLSLSFFLSFGEIAALLMSAFTGLPFKNWDNSLSFLFKEISSSRSTWKWNCLLLDQGHFGATSDRENVITVHPSSQNFFEVAWPMPRLPPVRIIILSFLFSYLIINRVEHLVVHELP